MSETEFIKRFQEGKLGPQDKDDTILLRLAFLMLRRLSFEEAWKLLREGRERLPELSGRMQDDSRLEQWLRLVAAAAAACDAQTSARDFAERNPTLAQPEVLDRYYPNQKTA